MSPNYTPEQTTFFFSMLTNLAGGMEGTPEEIERFVGARLDVHLQESVADIGVWTRVWGPAVYQAPLSRVADNVMYVVQSAETPPRLVAAIAGTNGASAFDVLIEDLYVENLVPWRHEHPLPGKDPRISVGTFIGLTALQCLTPGPGMPGANQRLPAFLGGALDRPMDVTITGHSLGGTLSVTLALWLLETQAFWDPAARATIYGQPSAALTAGNRDFASYYDGMLGLRTTRIYNSLDTIPHYWNDADMARLPALYEPLIEPDLVVEALAAAARLAASGGDYVQNNRTTPPLIGTINTGLINPASYAFENFLAQAGYQHVQEYLTLMGVTTTPETLTALNNLMGPPAAARAAARLRAQLRRRQAIA